MVLRGSARDSTSRSPADGDGSHAAGPSSPQLPLLTAIDARSFMFAVGLQSSDSTLASQPDPSPISTKATVPHHLHQSYSTAPPTMPRGTDFVPAPLTAEDSDGGEVLHIHNSTEVNTDSVAVEPSTSHLIHDAPIFSPESSESSPVAICPPGLVCASKTAAPIPAGDGNATEAESTPTRSNARGGFQSPGPDTTGISTEDEPGLTRTAHTEMEEEVLVIGEAAPGPLSRARRRVTLVLLETDGGVRLVGLPPDVTIEVEPAAVESFSDLDGPVGVDITRLPPPYHRYNS